VLVGAHAGRAARKEAAILTLKNLISADDDNDVADAVGRRRHIRYEIGCWRSPAAAAPDLLYY
jgi:hypothetical protein